MIMRRRPLLRAAVTAGGAYMAGKKVAGRQAEQQAYAEQPQEARPAATAADGNPGPGAEPAAASLSDRVSELTKLHDQGMLTDEEFSAAKAKVLGILAPIRDLAPTAPMRPPVAPDATGGRTL